MRNLKFLHSWATCVKGKWAAVPDNIAENLIAKGIAIDPTRPKPEPAKAKPKTAKPKVAKKKAATYSRSIKRGRNSK